MTTPTQGEHAQPEALRTIAEWPITDPSNMDAVNMAAVARAALTAAPQGGAYVENPAEIEHVAGDVSKNRAESNMTGWAYAELPTPHGKNAGEPFHYTADQMRDFADRTHALRASHGQAPAAEALQADLVAECERAMRQREEFLKTGVSTASHGGSHDTCFPAILRKHGVIAPAAGAVAGPVEQQVQRIGKELLRSEQMHAAKPDRIASALRAMSESMHTDYKQEIGSNNCMQCCVAYMLGMPISQVPHFAQSNDPVACWDGFQSFIAQQGYTAVMLPGDQRPESHYLASGKSARGTSHMVVMHDGKLLHDPHPTNAGLVDVQCIWLLAKSAAAPTPAAQGDAEDAARYRWLRDKNSHYLHNRAWLASITAVKDGPCDIFSADEVAALLDAEIDRRMAAALAQKEGKA